MLGAVGMDHWKFRITVTPAAYNRQVSIYDAWSLYSVQNISLVDIALDPNESYKIEVTNRSPDATYFELSSFLLYRAKSNAASNVTPQLQPDVKPRKRLSGGAIAGIVLGATTGAAVAASLAWVLYSRLQQRLHKHQIDMGSDAGDTVEHIVEPYLENSIQGGVDTDPSPSSAACPSDPAMPLPMSSSSPAVSRSFLNSLLPSTVTKADARAHAGGGAVVATRSSPQIAVQHVQHTDGGGVSQAAVVVETPPNYNSSWAASRSVDPSQPGQTGDIGTTSPSVDPGAVKAAPQSKAVVSVMPW